MKQITSLQHPLVQYWKQLKENPGFRHQEASVLIEGSNSIRDICKRYEAKRLIAISEECIDPEMHAQEVVIVSEQILKKLSSVETSRGLIAEFPLPVMKPLTGCRIIACDAIQDPGNLGTLMRSALAFGWDGMFLLPGCVDPFNDKVLRSAKGASFFLPLAKGSWQELLASVQEEQPVLVADLEGDTPEKFLEEQGRLTKKRLLILGNEGRGTCVPASLPHTQLCLPMKGQMESLNVAVAGSILMYLL